MNIDPFASSTGRVSPGTFVPDIAPGTPVGTPIPDQSDNAAGATSFRDTVKSLLDDVNTKMADAGQKSQDLATGRSNDFDGTVKSIEEATLAFQFTMAVRNKLMEAYTELQQMQV